MSNVTPSPFERDYRMYLEDMLEFSGHVISYAQGFSLEAWQADAMRVDATLRKLSLIGEAATRVPDTIRALAPGIPWRKIVGLRNRLMHAYPATDDSAVWSIVMQDLQPLQDELTRLLAALPSPPAA